MGVVTVLFVGDRVNAQTEIGWVKSLLSESSIYRIANQQLLCVG